VPLGSEGACAATISKFTNSKSVASKLVFAMVCPEEFAINPISEDTRSSQRANHYFITNMPFIINGETIDPGLIDSEFSQIKAFFEQQANVSCCERDDEFVGYAKDNITARVLLSQAAQEKLERPSEPDIDQRLEELKEQAGGEEAFYYGLGISPDQADSIRDDVANSVWLENYINQIAGDPIEPDEASIEAHYNENLKSYTAPEEVRAAHIFKSLQKVELLDELFEELRIIRKQLLAGEDFMELAEKHSDKPIDEVDLGFFKRGDLMDEFELITFSLDVGDITPVFSTQWGLHLAKVTDRKLPAPKPIEEVREQIIEEMGAQTRDEKIKVHVEELKVDAKIEDTPEKQED
jgi:parvulin-like peptidyl-prolyl isomerase